MNYICLSLEILVLKYLRSLIRRGATDYGRGAGGSFSLQQPTDYWLDPTKKQ